MHRIERHGVPEAGRRTVERTLLGPGGPVVYPRVVERGIAPVHAAKQDKLMVQRVVNHASSSGPGAPKESPGTPAATPYKSARLPTGGAPTSLDFAFVSYQSILRRAIFGERQNRTRKYGTGADVMVTESTSTPRAS